MYIAPASRGHIIILPKQHAANVFELSEELASKIYVVAQKIAKVVKEEVECEGINILQNNGEVAGQTVFHLHMHVIPRYTNDGIQIKWKQQEVDQEKIKELATKLATKLK